MAQDVSASEDLDRRSFIAGCGTAAGMLFVPSSLHGAAPAYPLHPHYREQTPFDEAVRRIAPGLDGFIREQHHDRIAAILDAWRIGLLQSPHSMQSIELSLSEKFLGSSWQPVESHSLRPGSPTLEVRRLRFAPQPSLPPETFTRELRAAMSGFSKILTAEFQITSIALSPGGLTTHVRYDLVGTGSGFYREQRTGYWSIDWAPGPLGNELVVRWQAHDEMRSRSTEPLFADVTHRAFGANASYSAQMLHGADYWRTVLDGACGIDIYGHNGVSVGDIDGDGYDDVYVCQPAGLPNRLYRNRGDGTFEDVTGLSGLGILENTACALIADFDNDGRQDIVVVRANGPQLFLNQGQGKFLLKPGAFHFANPPQGTFTGAAAADHNRDGWLDIYFCLYVYYQGADQYKYPSPYFAAENGPPNFLMHNNGDGTFTDATARTGLDKNNTRYSFCCGWGDYNRDGWPDLYVVNDFGRKNLYRNNGDGTFTDVARETGVEDLGAGMSVCWLDYDNDGADDLYVANMWTAAGERISNDEGFQKNAPPEILASYRKHAMGNSLFRNHNDGAAFSTVTEESRTGMGRWSWSSDSWDFDHDGFADIYIANGMISGPLHEDLNSFFWRQVVAKSPNAAKPAEEYEQGWKDINELIRADYSWSGFERNVFYANNRDGTFSDVSGAIGLDFVEDGRAFAVADFDGDGRQEMLLKNRNAPQLRLMKNTVSDLPPAIAFRLQGAKSNRDAIGTAVTIETHAGRQTKSLQAGSGFLSQHSKELFFGLGDAKGNVSAALRWPSGLVQKLSDLPPNHRVWVTEGSEPTRIEAFKAYAKESVSSTPQPSESFPDTVGTWLLAPVSAPDFSADFRGKPLLLGFDGSPQDLKITVRLQDRRSQVIVLHASDDRAATYNLLFRSLFDRHRDLPLPTSFLIDEHGQVVKIYQGRVDPATVENDFRSIPRTNAERLARALPFPAITATFEFGRNYLSLGSIFYQRGYTEAAEDFFRSALKDDPTSAEACYGLGSVYLKSGKNSQAQEYFERTVKLKANYPETEANAWNNLGILAARAGDTAKAIGYFERTLQLNPGHFVALENLGNAYRQQHRPEEARGALERALAIKPSDAEANYGLAMVFAQSNDTAHMDEYLRNALQARPDYPEALNNMGVLYLRTRRRNEAVAEFEKCIRVAPAFDQSYLNLARVYTIEGDSEKARTVLLALLTQHPNHALAQQALAQLH